MSDDDESMTGGEEPEWLRGARARLDAMYAADPRAYMGSKMARAWQFLYDRFNAVQGCLRLADAERLDTHAVRIGREIDDRWIEVAFDAPLASDYTPFPDSDEEDAPRSQSSRYQVIRESLVLMAVLARADYTTWIEELGRACQFAAPETINLDLAPLQRKFLFTFDAPASPSELEWGRLRPLFGDQGYDDHDFRSEFARAVEVAAAQGVDVVKMDPLPIHLRYIANPLWSEAQQIQALGEIRQTIIHMNEIEAKYRRTQCDSSNRTPHVPVFTVDSITLDMDNLLFSPPVLQALQSLIELGVPVKSLTLPVLPLPQEPDLPLRLSAWASLVSTICGHSKSPRPVAVHSVSISAMSASSPFLVSFLSALRRSRGLYSVMIAAGREFDEANSLWAWLAFSIFRADFPCPVEVLYLDNFEFTHDFNQFPSVIAADDPLACMWELLAESKSESRGYGSGEQPVLVREGSEINVKQARGQPGIVVRVPCEWVGELVIDDPTDPTLVVLLPGFGLCSISREFVATGASGQHHHSSVGTVGRVGHHLPWHRLRTLVLDAHATMVASDTATQQEDSDSDRLLLFFELIGRNLIDLDLSTNYLDGIGVNTVLRSCPRLESVRLSSMTLESMQFLAQHYETGGCRVSSLELRYMAIEHLVLEAFLRLLVTPGSAVKRTLKKLRLDEMWTTDLPISMIRVLMEIIEDPTSLDHLHVYMNSFDEVRELTSARLARFHGQVIPPSPLALVSRLALISALRLQGEHSAVMQLNQDMLRLVYALASEPKRRVILVECHTD